MKSALLIILFSFLSTVQAQNIYKTVDENGNLVYSSQPPEEAGNAEVLIAPPEPTAEEVQAARQQQKEIEHTLKDKSEKRDKAAQQRQKAQSEQETNSVVQTQLVPVPVYTNRRVARPHNLPVRRPVHRPVNRPR